jgi:hypothetical protein
VALPFTSLNAATATGPGASRDLETVGGYHGMIAWSTGSPATAQVTLEGSHDGSNWVILGTGVNATGGPASLIVPSSSTPGNPGLLVRYVRANLTSLSGGSSPTVTATIASDVEEED